MSDKKVTILLVEDEPDILDLMEEQFNDFGFKTLTACCGHDAISILENHSVNIVLSDFRMPNGNGRVILDEVNSIEAKNRPLFFFVSGHADISEEEALNNGVLKLFSKPFDLGHMIDTINDYCKKADLL